MAGEHTGRKQSIGIGKESTAGTAVSASAWLPKISGAFTPKSEVAEDQGAYGIIDSVKEVQTVKNWTEVQFSAVARDVYMGHILTALFGTTYNTVRFPVSSVSGTFSSGETITESTSTATGTLRRIDVSGSTPMLYIVPVAGTFTGGQTLTGGTSSATATGGTIIGPSAGRNHIFQRLNTNLHPTYTLYGSDPVSDDRAVYCMLDNLEFECVVGDYAKFTALFKGRQLASTSAQTPSYTTQTPFLAKHASLKTASAYSGLDAASALSVERVMLRFPKNLDMFYDFGETNADTIMNQDFGPISGEITLLYNAVTQRDYVINSTKQSMRLRIENTAATAVAGSSYPAIQFDFSSVGFREFSRTTENGGIVKQTLQFVAEYDATTRSNTCEAILQNTQTTAY